MAEPDDTEPFADRYADDPLVTDTEALVQRLEKAGDDQLLGNIARLALYSITDKEALVEQLGKVNEQHPSEAVKARHGASRSRELRRAVDVAEEAYRQDIRAEATQKRKAKDRAEPPPMVSLAELLERPREPVRFRFDSVWPVKGRVLVTAMKKTGKTTMVGNMLRSLVDGDPFLGRHASEPVERVVLVDDEMSEHQLQDWLGDQGIKAKDRVQVQPLRGAMSAFDILDPAVRRQWVDRFRGADVLVFDCLRPALDALGIDEDKDAGQFLVALDALCYEAGIPELVVIHHMGHNNERSRGSSRIEDWPDAIWRLVKEDADDPSSPRYFSAFGRDVAVEEARLSYDPFTRSYAVDGLGASRRQAKFDDLVQRVAAYIQDHPGVNSGDLAAGVMRKATDVRAAVQKLADADQVRVEPGAKNSRLHYWKADDGLI